MHKFTYWLYGYYVFEQDGTILHNENNENYSILFHSQGHSWPSKYTNGHTFWGVIFTPQNKSSDKSGQCDTTFSLGEIHGKNILILKIHIL